MSIEREFHYGYTEIGKHKKTEKKVQTQPGGIDPPRDIPQNIILEEDPYKKIPFDNKKDLKIQQKFTKNIKKEEKINEKE